MGKTQNMGAYCSWNLDQKKPRMLHWMNEISCCESLWGQDATIVFNCPIHAHDKSLETYRINRQERKERSIKRKYYPHRNLPLGMIPKENMAGSQVFSKFFMSSTKNWVKHQRVVNPKIYWQWEHIPQSASQPVKRGESQGGLVLRALCVSVWCGIKEFFWKIFLANEQLDSASPSGSGCFALFRALEGNAVVPRAQEIGVGSKWHLVTQ